MTQPIGVGLVGYGVSASALHVPLICSEPALRLLAVVSRHPDRVHRGVDVPVVSNVDRLLDDPAVEIVVVAAPNAVHHEIAAAALRAGRHVVVDKPFVVTTGEADDLVALATRTGRRLAVFHQRRWDSDYLTVRRTVADGVLGHIRTVIARYDRFRPVLGELWRERSGPGAGVLYDLGAHLIDQALQLFGWPETVTGDVRAQRPGGETDDYFHLVLGYGPLRVLLHAGSLVLQPGPRFEVHGDRGSYVSRGVDGQVAALLAGRRPGDPGWGRLDPEEYGTLTTTTDDGGMTASTRVQSVAGAYETFYRAMAAAVRGEGAVPVTAEEGRETVRLIECALASSREGRTIVLR
jgi:scyllo-inositol 2-dehydrogenase (NADP+)